MKKIVEINDDYNTEDFLELLEIEKLIVINNEFSATERQQLEDFKIHNISQNFNLWINPEMDNLEAKIHQIITMIGENNDEKINAMVNIIARITNNTSSLFGKYHLWLEIRAIVKNNFFEVTRWHTDSKFFEPLKVYKTVTALKGASTRFGFTAQKEKFNELSILENLEKHGSTRNFEIRKEIDTIVSGYEMIETGKSCVYHASGFGSVIHSEPEMNMDRVFLSIIAGEKEEIQFLENRMIEKIKRKSK